jgi:hypothetical protein
MPTYRVYVKQFIEEIAEQEVEANSEAEARQMVEDGEVDFDWQDGNETGDLEVTKIELVAGEEPDDEPEEGIEDDEDERDV